MQMWLFVFITEHLHIGILFIKVRSQLQGEQCLQTVVIQTQQDVIYRTAFNVELGFR